MWAQAGLTTISPCWPGALVLVAIAVPFLIPCFVPILAVFWWVRRRYVTTSREVKRFEGTTRSPVYSSFSAAVKVCVTANTTGHV